MKILKFAAHFVPLILSGEKTSTWRLFDDKNLIKGDELSFVNADTEKEFASAKILSVQEKKLKDVTETDYTAHEKYESADAMLRVFQGYYGNKANEDTIVKIIGFKVAKNEREAKMHILKSMGYNPVYIWNAQPNEEDLDHTHVFDTRIIVIDGEIEIRMNGINKTFTSEDEIDIPKETIHYGKAGANGCVYIVGEKHH